jgi:hypothetical protein
VVYVEIKDIARKYGVWRKKELEKHKSVGKTLHNAAPPLKILSWKEWKGKADKATKELLEDMRKGNTIDFNKEVW